MDMDWFVAVGWAYFLVAFCLIHTALIVSWFRHLQLRVEQMHWRLDTVWKKSTAWHSKVDKVDEGLSDIRTTLRRATGELDPISEDELDAALSRKTRRKTKRR